ncbi:hypothetical protein CGRA01v4_00831 [Colletotrichum graminicola]|nr:hypothetical protein CGRA01v4_00831 [Colletotrichum graminicola]
MDALASVIKVSPSRLDDNPFQSVRGFAPLSFAGAEHAYRELAVGTHHPAPDLWALGMRPRLRQPHNSRCGLAIGREIEFKSPSCQCCCAACQVLARRFGGRLLWAV